MVEGGDADQGGIVRVSLEDTRAKEEVEVGGPDGSHGEVGVVRSLQTFVD